MTSSPEKRVSFAAQLEVTRVDSYVLSPKNSIVQEENTKATDNAFIPSSLSDIRKYVDLAPNHDKLAERGPWSMGCFIDNICIAPGEREAEVTVIPDVDDVDICEKEKNMDAPGQKLPDMCSSSSSGSAAEPEEAMNNEEIDEDAFLPVNEDTMLNESAFLPEDEGFFPNDDSAFLPTEVDSTLIVDVAIGQEVEFNSKEFQQEDSKEMDKPQVDDTLDECKNSDLGNSDLGNSNLESHEDELNNEDLQAPESASKEIKSEDIQGPESASKEEIAVDCPAPNPETQLVIDEGVVQAPESSEKATKDTPEKVDTVEGQTSQDQAADENHNKLDESQHNHDVQDNVTAADENQKDDHEVIDDGEAIERELTSTECGSTETPEGILAEALGCGTTVEDSALSSLPSEETEVTANFSALKSATLSTQSDQAATTTNAEGETTSIPIGLQNHTDGEEQLTSTVEESSLPAPSSDGMEQDENRPNAEPKESASLTSTTDESLQANKKESPSTPAAETEKEKIITPSQKKENKELEELRLQLQRSHEDRRKAVAAAVKEIESRMKRDSTSEKVKVAQTAKLAHSLHLGSRDQDIQEREKKLEESNKEQVLKIAGAMKVATAVRNEFAEDQSFGELKTLKQSLGNLMKNQKAAITNLEASVKKKEKEIVELKNKCKEHQSHRETVQSSLKVADQTIISLKGELSLTKRKLRDTESLFFEAKTSLENCEQVIAQMTADLEVAAKDQDAIRELVSAFGSELFQKEQVLPVELRDQLKVAVEMLHKENKEMRSVTNYHSDQLLSKDRTIAELEDKLASLKHDDQHSRELEEENHIMRQKLEQMESDVRDLLESVKMAEDQKVELVTEHEQQVQNLNEQLRSLSQDCLSLRSILSSKSKLSASGSGEGLDELVAPSSSDSSDDKAIASAEKSDCEAPPQIPGSQASNGSVDPIFSCSQGGIFGSQGSSLSSAVKATDEEGVSQCTEETVGAVISQGRKEQKAVGSKRIWSLSCGCYVPSPSPSFQATQNVDSLSSKNSILEENNNKVELAQAPSEGKSENEESCTATSSAQQNESGEVIDDHAIGGVVLEGDEDVDLHQIEAILNTFENMVSDLSVQRSSSATLSESGDNGVEMSLSNQEEQSKESTVESQYSSSESSDKKQSSDQQVELNQKINSLGGQLLTILGDSKPSKAPVSSGDQILLDKVGMFKAAFKTLQFEKERTFKEAEGEKNRAIAEMQAKLEQEKDAARNKAVAEMKAKLEEEKNKAIAEMQAKLDQLEREKEAALALVAEEATTTEEKVEPEATEGKQEVEMEEEDLSLLYVKTDYKSYKVQSSSPSSEASKSSEAPKSEASGTSKDAKKEEPRKPKSSLQLAASVKRSNSSTSKRAVPHLKTSKSKGAASTKVSALTSTFTGMRRSQIKPPTPTSRLGSQQSLASKTQNRKTNVPSVKTGKSGMGLKGPKSVGPTKAKQSKLPKPGSKTKLSQPQTKSKVGRSTGKQVETATKNKLNSLASIPKDTSKPASNIPSRDTEANKADELVMRENQPAADKPVVSTKNLEDSFASLLRTRDSISSNTNPKPFFSSQVTTDSKQPGDSEGRDDNDTELDPAAESRLSTQQGEGADKPSTSNYAAPLLSILQDFSGDECIATPSVLAKLESGITGIPNNEAIICNSVEAVTEQAGVQKTEFLKDCKVADASVALGKVETSDGNEAKSAESADSADTTIALTRLEKYFEVAKLERTEGNEAAEAGNIVAPADIVVESVGLVEGPDERTAVPETEEPGEFPRKESEQTEVREDIAPELQLLADEVSKSYCDLGNDSDDSKDTSQIIESLTKTPAQVKEQSNIERGDNESKLPEMISSE